MATLAPAALRSLPPMAGIRRWLLIVWLIVLIAGVGARALPVQGQAPHAVVIDLETIIHPIADRYLGRAVDRAVESGATVAVVALDTPGGLLSSTRNMVTTIFQSPIPVIVYVSPAGSRAASAGTFITAAAHIAAMAPGTNIGAASPILGDGSDINETLKDKVVEDTAAEIRAIAQRRGRPEAPLEATVLEAKAYTAQEALDLGIIDLIANNVPLLLEAVDGMTVMVDSPTGEREVTLDTSGLAIEQVGYGFFDRLLSLIADPNIAFFLISMGGLGIYFELVAPGTIFPGVFGVIALILGFVGLGNLPGNWAGAALILLAFGLFIAEVNVDGFGVLGLMGAASFVVGGIIIFGHFGTPDPGFPDVTVSTLVLVPMAIVVGGIALITAFASITSRRSPHTRTATMLLVGEQGVVETMLGPEGIIRVRGERWSAVSGSGETIALGAHIRVVQEDGALLTVEPGPASKPDPTASEPRQPGPSES